MTGCPKGGSEGGCSQTGAGLVFQCMFSSHLLGLGELNFPSLPNPPLDIQVPALPDQGQALEEPLAKGRCSDSSQRLGKSRAQLLSRQRGLPTVAAAGVRVWANQEHQGAPDLGPL